MQDTCGYYMCGHMARLPWYQLYVVYMSQAERNNTLSNKGGFVVGFLLRPSISLSVVK